MEDLEEMYENLCYIFSNDRCVAQSIKENIYQLDYVRVFVLCMAYLHLCDIPKNVLELCINCEIDENIFNETYSFLSDKWELKAKQEIDDLIYNLEYGNEI